MLFGSQLEVVQTQVCCDEEVADYRGGRQGGWKKTVVEKGWKMMSPSLQNRNAPSKNCTVPGCGGMMTLRRPQEVGSASSSSGATWVCSNNPSHIEVVTPAEQ